MCFVGAVDDMSSSSVFELLCGLHSQESLEVSRTMDMSHSRILFK